MVSSIEPTDWCPLEDTLEDHEDPRYLVCVVDSMLFWKVESASLGYARLRVTVSPRHIHSLPIGSGTV